MINCMKFEVIPPFSHLFSSILNLFYFFSNLTFQSILQKQNKRSMLVYQTDLWPSCSESVVIAICFQTVNTEL